MGYPDSVTPDYLAYQLWAVPSHITGWMGSSLITSSLLAAVGLKAGAGTAAAGAASIRWITKDGIGAIGRLLVSTPCTLTHMDAQAMQCSVSCHLYACTASEPEDLAPPLPPTHPACCQMIPTDLSCIAAAAHRRLCKHCMCRDCTPHGNADILTVEMHLAIESQGPWLACGCMAP